MAAGDPDQLVDRRLAADWAVAGDSAASSIRRPDGVSCESTFVASQDGYRFTAFHDPVADPEMGVVICPPALAEAIRNQRRELVLAWELSTEGVAAARFHYTGSGHSTGKTEELAFERMVGDAVATGEALKERTGASAISFVGTRLGALVAAAAARSFTGGALVLWEPPTDLRRYYRSVFRARIIGLFKRGESVPRTEKQLMDDLERDGSVDIAGSPLAMTLYQSTIDLDLTELITDARCDRVLIVQLSVKPELRARMSDVVKACASQGVSVVSAVVEHDEAWWFGATGTTVVDTQLDAVQAIPLTTEFIGAV